MATLSGIQVSKVIDSGSWQKMTDGTNRMVNIETGEILNLIQWVERYKR